MASSAQTAGCDQTTISDITDVSWTLRKTSFIEGGARNFIEDAKILLDNPDSNYKKRKLGNQKKETLPKNLDRMSAAHLAVESIDSEVQECQTKFKAVKKRSQRKLFTNDYKRKKVLLDSAYTELKRAQEEIVKSIHVQRQQINSSLESSKEDSDQGFTHYAGIIFRIKRKAKESSILPK